MERKIILTGDGSHSISVPEMEVTYHSVHGTVQESLHVFIEAGLRYRIQNGTTAPLKILEMGLGTGLNALLTLIEADKLNIPLQYTAIDLFPLNNEAIRELNFCETLNRSHYQMPFEKIHSCDWENETSLTPFFTLHKMKCDLVDFSTDQSFDLIYFDAFAPNAQPELWTPAVFGKLYGATAEKGILVTYCSKGDVRRALQSAGFRTEKIPGPPGKREMLRGRKQ